jgi:hypothetical protein
MDERASSKEREETDLHVCPNTAIKISDGHVTTTPLYIRTVCIWRQRNVTAMGTTEMFMSSCYCRAYPSAVRTYSYIYVRTQVLM